MAADALEHGRVVLAAIIPNRPDLLDEATHHLDPEQHLVDSNQVLLLDLLNRYSSMTGDIMPRGALGDYLRGRADPGRVLLLEEMYDALSAGQVNDSDFKHSLEQLRELAAERTTREALTVGMEILRSGVRDTRGNEQRGHYDARVEVLQRFSDIDRNLMIQNAPEGAIKSEGAQILQEYADQFNRQQRGEKSGVKLGVPSVDFYTGGFHPGELILLAGYSSDGKTTTCVQGAWSCAVEQGKNVVILTTETSRAQVRRRLMARHSMLPVFGLPEGINSKDIKEGTIKPEHLPVFQAVVHDLTNNSLYGTIYIAQVPRQATIVTCEALLYRIQRTLHIDMVYIDYLALLRADVRRDSDREYLGAIIKEAKQLATTFNGGEGVPVCSPWQVNRKAKEYADQFGKYQSEHLAETAEATNSSDIIISQLAAKDKDARVRDVMMQILKNRDGETVVNTPLRVRVDFATSAFLQAGEAVAARGLVDLAYNLPPPEMLGVLS